MKLFDWLFGKRENEQPPTYRFIGSVVAKPGAKPYLMVFEDGRCFCLRMREGVSVRLDRKCIPQLIPLLEKVKIDE